VPKPDPTRGGWYGSSRISRAPIPTRYLSSYRTTPMTKTESMRWNIISTRIPQSSQSSTRTRSPRHHSLFQRTYLKCFCIENRKPKHRPATPTQTSRNVRKEKDNEQHFYHVRSRHRGSQKILGLVSRNRDCIDGSGDRMYRQSADRDDLLHPGSGLGACNERSFLAHQLFPRAGPGEDPLYTC
jgi:hypothetical protein